MNAVRRLVSGKKSRLVDDELGVDLDLCLLTDRVILMGYPASGIEGLYRNKRKDVKRWLQARYERHWLIFNFCPRHENSYDAEFFYGQVRRFPFPDHHPPPLSIIPLFVHEVESFLGASEENVAVIHCRAGKGRTGTLAICYLLALPTLPEPPKSAAPLEAKARPRSAFWASGNPKVRVASQRSTPPSPTPEDAPAVDRDGGDGPEEALSDEPGSLRGGPEDAQATEDDALKGTSLDSTVDAAVTAHEDGSDEDSSALLADRIKFLLHLQSVIVTRSTRRSLKLGGSASRRMADPTITYGVSIPSQRRWIRYWGQMLTAGDPRLQVAGRLIRLLWVKIDMPKEGIAGVPGGNRVAVQVSAYKDAYVADLKSRNDALNQWKRTGKTSGDAEPPPSSQDKEWDDKGTLLYTFASFGSEDATPDTSADEAAAEGSGKVTTRTLWPIRIYPKEGGSEPKVKGRKAIDEAGGVTVGGEREVQLKIVLGTTGSRHASLPDVSSLGYFWFVPAFIGGPGEDGPINTAFAKGEIDFRKKQSGIERVEVGWTWV